MIKSKDLTFHYSKNNKLFSDLAFNQNAGNITGLLGKNGAGKSTLFKLIAGLIKPSRGTLEVNGYIPFYRNPNFLSDIYLVTDEPFFPSLSIAGYTKIYAPFYKNFDSGKMNEILQDFELKGEDKLHRISYGQQKKFIIAFALATNCKLLLLDEPTNGLDIPSKRIFRKVLVSSIEENQLVLISTHQVKDIETIIDKILIIEDGEIVFEKDTALVSENLQFKKVSNLESVSNILYHEKCPEGYNVLYSDRTTTETDMDIELLFNAISNKTEILF
jgi:ABC-2 type transport system ATP-binding protein